MTVLYSLFSLFPMRTICSQCKITTFFIKMWKSYENCFTQLTLCYLDMSKKLFNTPAKPGICPWQIFWNAESGQIWLSCCYFIPNCGCVHYPTFLPLQKNLEEPFKCITLLQLKINVGLFSLPLLCTFSSIISKKNSSPVLTKLTGPDVNFSLFLTWPYEVIRLSWSEVFLYQILTETNVLFSLYQFSHIFLTFHSNFIFSFHFLYKIAQTIIMEL